MATKTESKRNFYSVAGLFSGIGGLELGLSRAGHKTIFQCENYGPAQEVLRKRFTGCKRQPDVRKLNSVPTVDLVAAGFPCQDLSQAGQTRGIKGQNSGLIDYVFDLIAKKRKPPRWLLFENVPFMLQLDRGKAMRHLTRRLTKLDYRWAYRVVDARAFGLPQRRRRVILLASRSDDPKAALFSDDAGIAPDFDQEASASGFYWTEGNRGLGWTADGVPTLKGGSSLGIPSPPAIWMRSEDRLVTPDIRDAERLQGLPVNWTSPAVHSSNKRGVRWKLVGNAVCVPVASWIGRRLALPGKYDPSNDAQLSGSFNWPSAAWGEEAKVYSSSASEWPIHARYKSLDSFLRFTGKSLSERATAGFLSRASGSSLRFPEGFLHAVESHLNQIRSDVVSL